MRLISETVEVGGPVGPRYPKVYPASDAQLYDPQTFLKGPPHAAFAEAAARSAGGVERRAARPAGLLVDHPPRRRDAGEPGRGDLLLAEGRHPDDPRAQREPAGQGLARRDDQHGRAGAPAASPRAHALLHAQLPARAGGPDQRRGRPTARRDGADGPVRPGAIPLGPAAALHPVRDPRRAAGGPAQVPHLDALPGTGQQLRGRALGERLGHGERGGRAAARGQGLHRGVQRRRRRDVRLRPRHAAQAPPRPAGRPDERHRPRAARGRLPRRTSSSTAPGC